MATLWQQRGIRKEFRCVYTGVDVGVGVCACMCVCLGVYILKKNDVGNQKRDGSTRHYNVC